MDKELEGPLLCSSSVPEQLCFHLLGIEGLRTISIAEKTHLVTPQSSAPCPRPQQVSQEWPHSSGGYLCRRGCPYLPPRL